MASYCDLIVATTFISNNTIIVQFDKTIVLPRKLATGSIHDYIFYYCSLVGILFGVLRIVYFASFAGPQWFCGAAAQLQHLPDGYLGLHSAPKPGVR